MARRSSNRFQAPTSSNCFHVASGELRDSRSSLRSYAKSASAVRQFHEETRCDKWDVEDVQVLP